MSVSERQIIESYLDNARKLEKLRAAYPLALARLWRPHCHRWNGRGSKSERMRGCGQEMTPLSNGLYHCANCNITEQRTCQQEALLRLGSEATLISGGNRAGKSEIGAMLCVATAAGRDAWWVKESLQLNNLHLDVGPSNPSNVWL